MIPLNHTQSTAMRLLVLAFKACRDEDLNESFVLDHLFSNTPGPMSGELHSYRRTFWMRNSCGSVQSAELAPLPEDK